MSNANANTSVTPTPAQYAALEDVVGSHEMIATLIQQQREEMRVHTALRAQNIQAARDLGIPVHVIAQVLGDLDVSRVYAMLKQI